MTDDTACESLRTTGPVQQYMSSVPERSEIDSDYRWDLSSVYSGDDDWEAALEAVTDTIETLETMDADAITDAESLHTVLTQRDQVLRETATITAYARMRRDEDTRDQTGQAMHARAQSVRTRAASAVSFIDPAIQQFDRETIEEFLATTPELEPYDQYLDDVLRLEPHTRSPEIEAVLADFSEVTDAPRDIYQTLTNADFTFPTVEDPDGEAVEITLANFTRLQKRPIRSFRQDVYTSFYDHWAQFRNAIGTAYAKSVRTDVTTAQTRNYDTARQAALHSANIPGTVYDTLVDTVMDSTVADRHAQLKRETLGLDELRMWDLYVPLAESSTPTIEYETATDYVTEALGALGESYQDRVKEGLDARWVDVYETQGKRSGAYSGGTYDTQPFILMNYQDDVSSMYTLAHELGHSIHSQLTSEHQPYVNSHYEIFVAEVASTVNEVLLTRYLLDTLSDEHLRRHILNEYLERFRSTLFRQTMFAAFEDRTHALVENGEALTPDRLADIYTELKTELYPSATLDEHIGQEWMRIPHFYRAFYVYQYATGISAAVAIATDILDRGQPAADQYLEALKRGSADYPVDILATAGVDVTSPTYLDAAIDEYDRALEEMSTLLSS